MSSVVLAVVRRGDFEGLVSHVAVEADVLEVGNLIRSKFEVKKVTKI